MFVTIPGGPRGVDAVVAGDRQRRQDGERAVRAGTLTAEAHGVQATPTVRTGDPARQIIAVADETHAATIVVGDRGVPATVALHARRHDVLVVRTALP